MSTISNQFRRFYFGVVLNQAFDEIIKVKRIYFPDWKDINNGGPLYFDYGVDFFDMEDLRTIMKYMDINYPVDGDSKVSNKNISNKELVNHVEWIIKTLGENSLELDFIREEWTRIMENATI